MTKPHNIRLEDTRSKIQRPGRAGRSGKRLASARASWRSPVATTMPLWPVDSRRHQARRHAMEEWGYRQPRPDRHSCPALSRPIGDDFCGLRVLL